MTAKYAWIKKQHQCYPIAVMCQVLKVSKSGYYDWCKRQRHRRRKPKSVR